MIEETIVASNAKKLQAEAEDETKKRMSTPQCQRSVEDLRKQIEAQKAGTSELKLKPEIFLCQQHLRDEQHARQSIAHELIHAIDMCR